eukprot:1410505-Pyramimonas_sp.AAC.4
MEHASPHKGGSKVDTISRLTPVKHVSYYFSYRLARTGGNVWRRGGGDAEALRDIRAGGDEGALQGANLELAEGTHCCRHQFHGQRPLQASAAEPIVLCRLMVRRDCTGVN